MATNHCLKKLGRESKWVFPLVSIKEHTLDRVYQFSDSCLIAFNQIKKIRFMWNRPKKRREPSMLHQVFSLLFLLLQFDNTQANQELSDELRFIHKEIVLLKNENQQQNVQIAHLKEIITESQQEDQSAGHGKVIKGAGNHQERMNEDHRPRFVKRPARLLPAKILFGRRKNSTDDMAVRRFYGPPTNCSDLSHLGYTLNGFYMVKASSHFINNTVSNNETHIETLYCAFKQPEGTFNESLVEKRISPLKSEGFSRPPSTGIVQLKIVSNKNVINFRSQPTSLTILKTSQLKFPRIVTNVGGGFSVNSGVFLAPKPGVYKFIFKGTLLLPQKLPKFKPGTVLVYFCLMYNNGLEVGKAKFVPDSGFTAKELMIEEALKLNRGDKVYIQPGTETSNINNLDIVELDQDNSSFSGFLLHEFDE